MAAQYTIPRSAQGQIRQEVGFVIRWIDPVMHELLNTNPKSDHYDSPNIIQEAADIVDRVDWTIFC